MNAWLVINDVMKNNKFTDIYNKLKEGAKKHKVSLKEYTNVELLSKLRIVDGEIKLEITERPAFILFWDKDVFLASLLESLGFKVHNAAKSIEICDNKALTIKALLAKKIRMPKTFFSPLLFSEHSQIPDYFWKDVIKELGFPFVIKECYGSFGEQVYLVKKEEEILSCLNKIKSRPFIIQEYIKTSKGRDVRVYTVNKKAVAAILRTNELDFRANYGSGAKAKAYHLNDKFLKMAEKVANSLELDFGGIDILFGENEEPIFCEANSNAHFRKLEDCTGIDIGDKIIRTCIKCQEKEDC